MALCWPFILHRFIRATQIYLALVLVSVRTIADLIWGRAHKSSALQRPHLCKLSLWKEATSELGSCPVLANVFPPAAIFAVGF